MPGQLVTNLGGSNGFGENVLPVGDDSPYAAVDITSVFGPAGINFFGIAYTQLYINNNGNITFNAPFSSFTPGQISSGTGNPIIAAFWADVDTISSPTSPTPGGTSTGANRVFYDLDAATGTLTVTWDDVGYFNDGTDKANAFQIQLINQGGGNFDIVYRYENINWTTGDANGGTAGLGGVPARAGYSAGDGVNYFELPQSGIEAQVLELENTLGNSGQPGVWTFAVRNGQLNLVSTGTAVDDTLTGGTGNDTLKGLEGNDTLTGLEGDDALDGGTGDDTLDAGGGNDTVEAGDGNDTIVAGHGGGNDTYSGGFGIDLIKYASTLLGIVVDLEAGTARDKQAKEIDSDIIRDIENVLGGAGGDSIKGSAVSNHLSGGAGNDVLEGGMGQDTLEGGAGADRFVFSSAKESARGALRDMVVGFEKGVDDIDLSLIDAEKGKGNQRFSWVDKGDLDAKFTGDAGELRYKGGVLSGDTNGDKRADFEIHIGTKIGAGDVIL